MKRLSSLYSLFAILLAAGAASLHAQNVVVDKSSLTFSAQFGGSTVSQTLTITSSTGSALTFFASSNAAWLKVNGQPNASGNTPSTVTVTADPTGLPAATYTSSVSIFGGPNTVSVAITMTVSTIGANPTSLAFSGYTAGSLIIPTQQSITLSGASTTFSADVKTDNGGNWLQVTPTSGTSPGAVTAVLNPAIVPGLAVGTYTGQITITPTSGTSTIPVIIPVTFAVTAAPVVSVSPASLLFNVQNGGTNNITSQVLTVSVNPVSQIGFGFTASLDSGLNGRVTINPPSGNTNAQTGAAQVTFAVDTSNLAPNTYNGTITVYTPGATPAQQSIPLHVTVSNSPLLNIPSTPLNFAYNLGGAVPAAQTVNVTSTGAVLNYSIAISANTSWLTVNAPAQPNTGVPFTVAVNPTGLTAGTYTGTITVTGAVAGSGTQQIPVSFTVTNNPTIVTNFDSMSFPFQIGKDVPKSQQMIISSSNGAQLNITATPSLTTCTSSNWLILNGNPGVAVTGTTDSSLNVAVNPTGLAAGNCDGVITISATVAATGVAVNSVSVPVRLYVSATPMLVVDQPVLNFTVPVGGGTSGIVTNILVTSTSAASADQISFSVSVPAPASGPPWFNTLQQAGSTSANPTITVQVTPSTLPAGKYKGSIIITALSPSGVANSPVTVPVNLTVTAGTLTVSPGALTFSQTLGGSAPAPQTVTVGSSGPALTYTVVTNSGSTAGWLSVTPTKGTTTANSTLTVSVDSTNLTAGTYNGTITVTSPSATNPVPINVTFTVQAGTISAPTTTLTFSQLAGGPAPAAQSIAVSGSPGSLNYTVATSQNTSWLSVSPSSGATPGGVQVSVNAGSLPAGQYTGNVIITSARATGSPITVPVVLNVLAAQTLAATPASLKFTYTVGQAVPASQVLAISSSGGAAPISVQLQPSGQWLQVVPVTGTAPLSLAVSVVPGSLTAGDYNGTITLSSSSALAPLTVTVTLTVIVIPKPIVSAIGNAASYATGNISPGENIVIFGTGVGPATLINGTIANGVFATTAGNTRVLFDGIAAPVIYASSTQTSVMVPYGLNGRTTTNVVVEFTGVSSTALAYNVVPAAPGIYSLNQQGTGPGAVLNQDGITVNSPNTPAPRSSVIAVYMTGEGQTNPIGSDGLIIPAVVSALKTPLLDVTATVAGIPAKVLYKGSAPGIVSGVMQVNIEIPATAPTGGAVPLQVTVGTATTQTGITIAVSQ